MNRRVLFVIGSGEVGGAERQLATLVEHLAGSNWQPGLVFTRAGGPIEAQIRLSGAPTWVPRRDPRPAHERSLISKFKAGLDILQQVATVRRAVREFKPDLVHAMLPTSIWMGLAAVRPRRVKRVAGVRGFTPDMSTPVRFMYRRQLRLADAVVCNAPHLVTEMEQSWQVDSSRLAVIRNGVEIPQWRSDPARQPPVGLVIANFHSYKGHDVLVRALPDVDPAVIIHCCGSGTERETTRRLADLLGVGHRINLVESPADVWAELRSAQFLVHPSRTEGLPNAVLEAMAAGLPVIASNVGGIPLLVQHGVHGLLVEPGDIDLLASAIGQLAADPERRLKMGAAARSRAAEFSWDSCAHAHAELYDRLVRR
jgi:glycosyltransferase involved in cell wall biosynthesis